MPRVKKTESLQALQTGGDLPHLKGYADQISGLHFSSKQDSILVYVSRVQKLPLNSKQKYIEKKATKK